jgi:hypothetical protein
MTVKHYAGLDVSTKETPICVVDERRKVLREVKAGRIGTRSDCGLAVGSPPLRFGPVGFKTGSRYAAAVLPSC